MSICIKHGNYNITKSFTIVQIEQLKKSTIIKTAQLMFLTLKVKKATVNDNLFFYIDISTLIITIF